jgi:hypothetical protein
MAYKDHRWFSPTVEVQPEILEIYRTTHQFYDEVQHREAVDRYCAWYYDVAEQHRRELEKLRGDINLFGWFSRRR